MTVDRLDSSALERELVIACMAHPDTMDAVHVPSAEWCDSAAGAAFDVCAALHSKGETINALTVRDALQAAGGSVASWLDEPSWVKFTPAKLTEFHERAEMRRTRAASRALVALCESGDVASARLAAQDIAGLQDASPADGEGPRLLGELAVEAAESGLTADKSTLLHLGLDFLQDAVGGMMPGNMVTIGADTGVGKSSMALAMALGMSKRFPVGIVSCEDSAGIWGARAAASATGVSSLRIITGTCRKYIEDSDRLASYIAKPKPMFIALDCQIGKPEVEVLASMRRLAASGAKVLFVDYVQAILSSNKRAQRNDQVREIAARIKGQADALGCGLVLLSQLSRPGKDKGVREPNKHDLKESGDLENASELIILLWLADPNDPSTVSVKLEKGKWGAMKRLHTMRRDESGTLAEVAEYAAGYGPASGSTYGETY